MWVIVASSSTASASPTARARTVRAVAQLLVVNVSLAGETVTAGLLLASPTVTLPVGATPRATV